MEQTKVYVTNKRPGCQKTGILKMHCSETFAQNNFAYLNFAREKIGDCARKEMAASFKLPSLTKKRRRAFEFPELPWSLKAGHLVPSIWRILNLEIEV